MLKRNQLLNSQYTLIATLKRKTAKRIMQEHDRYYLLSKDGAQNIIHIQRLIQYVLWVILQAGLTQILTEINKSILIWRNILSDPR